MERKSDIRKALNSFLHTPTRPETLPVVESAAAVCPSYVAPAGSSRLLLSEPQKAVLRVLQDSLRQNGIDAELEEIGHGILEALAARPSLCRGLLAAYFLEV